MLLIRVSPRVRVLTTHESYRDVVSAPHDFLDENERLDRSHFLVVVRLGRALRVRLAATTGAATTAETRAIDETHSNVVQQKSAVPIREGVAKQLIKKN